MVYKKMKTFQKMHKCHTHSKRKNGGKEQKEKSPHSSTHEYIKSTNNEQIKITSDKKKQVK